MSGLVTEHEEDQLAVLNLQQLLSLIQIICFLIYYTMSVSPDYGSDWYQRNARYIVFTAVLIYSLVVPVLSIIHWIIQFNTNIGKANLLRAFTLIFPLIGVCNIFLFFVFIREVISQIRQELYLVKHDGWDSLIENLMESSWSAAIYKIHQAWEDEP